MTWFIELQNRFNESRLFKTLMIYVLNWVDNLTSWHCFLSCHSIKNWSYTHLKTSFITAVTAVTAIIAVNLMSLSLFSAMQSCIHVHFNHSNFTVFIFKVIEVNVIQIRKMRRSYIIINIITASLDERSFKLSDYHAEQLIEYLHQRLTVYQDEMIWFLFNEFSIVIDQSIVFKLLVTWKWSKKLIKHMTVQRNEILREKWKFHLTD